MGTRSIWSRTGLVACGAVLVFALAACGNAAPDAGGGSGGGDTYKVGAILSLTGTYASLGSAEKNALELEVKRINDAGGVNGKRIELLIEDDGTDEAKAVAAASKLIEQDGVIAILGASGTGQTMAVRSEIDRAGIPQLSMAGGTAVTASFDKLVFQTPWSNTLVVPFVLQRVATDGHTKIAVLSDSGGYGKDGLAVIQKQAPQAGLSIVSDQTFNAGDTDFSAQLTKIKSSGAQALVLWTAGKEGAAIVKSAGELGVGIPMYGGSGQAKTEFVDGAGAAAEGFVFGTGKSLVPANWGEGTPAYEVVSGFAERYKAAYGTSPDIFAGHAFDALNILVDALKRANGDTSPAAMTAAVEGTKDLIGFGGTYTFSATDHNGLTADDLSLYKVTAGAWEPVQ